MPSQINKTGEYLEIPARITEFHDELKRISDYTKPDDLIFAIKKLERRGVKEYGKKHLST